MMLQAGVTIFVVNLKRILKLKKRVCQVNCVSFFENCNLVGATPTKLKKAARSVEVI